MPDPYGYQVVEIRNDWNANKDTTCADWAASRQGRVVVERNSLTGRMRILPDEEAQQAADNLKRLRDL
jgi:hypothetical protein